MHLLWESFFKGQQDQGQQPIQISLKQIKQLVGFIKASCNLIKFRDTEKLTNYQKRMLDQPL
jgi:hypothetical protein